MGELNKKLPASLESDGIEISSKGKGRESDLEAYRELAMWCSDWHLLAFVRLEMVGGLIEEVR